MIRHIVLTKFKPETPEDKISEIYAGLSALSAALPGAQNFTGGRSESPEQIERGYMHGFVIDFDNWDALQTYVDLSRFCAAPSARLGHLPFKGDRAFPTQC